MREDKLSTLSCPNAKPNKRDSQMLLTRHRIHTKLESDKAFSVTVAKLSSPTTFGMHTMLCTMCRLKSLPSNSSTLYHDESLVFCICLVDATVDATDEHSIMKHLRRYVTSTPCWLVVNKIDLMPRMSPGDRSHLRQRIVHRKARTGLGRSW